MNINDYTGIAYNFREYNCWHHVRHIRGLAGLTTPEFDVVSTTGINEAFASGHADPKGLRQVTSPEDFDAVLMGTVRAGRTVWHSGVYFGGMVSHCDRFAKQVKLEALSDIKQGYQRIEFWR